MSRAASCLTLALLVTTVSALTNDEINQFTARTHVEGNTNIQGDVEVRRDGEYLIIESNGIPDHDTGTFPGVGNPNNIQQKNFAFKIPNSPQFASEPSCLPMGPIAVGLNGVPLFNPLNAEGEDAVKVEIFDTCNGHPDMQGVYHYHQDPNCIVGSGKKDNIVGVALDGYPIYSMRTSTGIELTTSDLDECHGHMYNGRYMYRITKQYPYILACYKGTRVIEDNGRQPPENCIHESGQSRLSMSLFTLVVPFMVLVINKIL